MTLMEQIRIAFVLRMQNALSPEQSVYENLLIIFHIILVMFIPTNRVDMDTCNTQHRFGGEYMACGDTHD